jgi:hypothetical protein
MTAHASRRHSTSHQGCNRSALSPSFSRWFIPIERSGRIERTDRDVISVGIAERKPGRSSSVGIHVRLFEPADQRPRPWQRHVEIADPEEQEQAVAGSAWRGLVNEGCSWAPHLCRQSQTAPSTICPQWSQGGSRSTVLVTKMGGLRLPPSLVELRRTGRLEPAFRTTCSAG